MSELRLASVNGEPTIGVELAPDGVPTAEQLMAGTLVAMAEAIVAGTLKISRGMIVAVIDGSVTYEPLGAITVLEAGGMLEMASRKVERDARGE